MQNPSKNTRGGRAQAQGRFPHRRGMAWRLVGCLIAFAATSGCLKLDDSPTPRASRDGELFGPPGEREHDFGLVIAKPGLQLTHTFPLRNTTERPLRLLRVINRKPCCGEVRFTPTTLLAGQMTCLDVTLKVGESTEPLSHLAVVETDDPEFPSRQFFTFARPHPRFTLEPQKDNATLVRAGTTSTAHYTAMAFATPGDRPPSLDDAVILSNAPAQWIGSPKVREVDGGLIASSRPLSLSLIGDGTPGERVTSVEIARHGERLFALRAGWKVDAAIKSAPGALVIGIDSEPSQSTISLRSEDGKAFRITGIRSDLACVVAWPRESGARPIQSVAVQIEPAKRDSTRVGKLTIRTDHPFQPDLNVPVYVTGKAQGTSDHREAP